MVRCCRAGLLGLLVNGMMMAEPASAIEPDNPRDSEKTAAASRKVNVPAPTFGGTQFWGDVRFFRGWRIQQNIFTGHHRLIDRMGIRWAWGAREACEEHLDGVIRTKKLKPMNGTAVVLLHGAIRSSKSMKKMGRALADDGYTVVPFDYPSSKAGIEMSADYLQQVIESLDGITRIHFVTHSMGGLVVRSWSGRYRDKRAGRLVMLGVPNYGARMADHLKGNLLFRLIYGHAGQQLRSDPEGFISNLPVPKFEFGVIAGQAGTPRGFNPLVPGDDDGTVSVDSTRLSGATDFATVRAGHSFLMFNSQVIEWTSRYLKHGHFRKDGSRQPISSEPKPTKGSDSKP